VKRFAAGVYYDEESDTIHLVADELLKGAGYPSTPENLEMVRVTAREVFGAEWPNAKVTEEGFK
jgi:hypothetical protein